MNEVQTIVETQTNDKVNEIFANVQNHFGIEYGDIDPEQAMRLDEIQNDLTDLISQIIENQIAMKGEQ